MMVGMGSEYDEQLGDRVENLCVHDWVPLRAYSKVVRDLKGVFRRTDHRVEKECTKCGEKLDVLFSSTHNGVLEL